MFRDLNQLSALIERIERSCVEIVGRAEAGCKAGKLLLTESNTQVKHQAASEHLSDCYPRLCTRPACVETTTSRSVSSIETTYPNNWFDRHGDGNDVYLSNVWNRNPCSRSW